MSIKINRGKIASPVRVMIQGVEGVGKSSFAAAAPGVVFLCAESGTNHLDVARVDPPPKTWSGVLETLTELAHEKEFHTVCVDPVNWLEPLVWDSVCLKHKVSSIEEVGGGYGKGYTEALSEWRRFVAALDTVWASGKHIIVTGHTEKKLFKNPEGDDFDRYQLALNDKAYALLRQWFDVILFARFEVGIAKRSKQDRARGVSTGNRVIHTEWSAAFDAKNRYGLPATMPLDWPAFFEAVKSGAADSLKPLRDRLFAALKELDDEASITKAQDYIRANGESHATLGALIEAAEMKLEKRNGKGAET